MESISSILEPYEKHLSTIATFFTVLQFFSGVFICKTIYTARSTKDMSAVASSFICSIVMYVFKTVCLCN